MRVNDMESINPRVDIAFKKIFGVEENKDLLISLINSIVGKEDQVAEVTLLNPYNQKNFKQDKLSIVDIKAKGVDGKMFNIEIQINDEADYDKRALYYWAKLYGEQLQSGSNYSALSKAIGIHILNFTSIPEVARYHNVFHITEKESGLLYFSDLELHTIELNKFSRDDREDLSDIVSKVRNSLDRWVAFLTRWDLLRSTSLPAELDDPALKKAIHVLDVMNLNIEERELYEGHLKWLRAEASALKKAFDKGIAKGEAMGRAEGEALGKRKEKMEIAKNLLKQGCSLEIVQTATGLSAEEISSLQL